VLLWQLGTSGDRVGTLTLFARLQSGLPYTPLVAGDVNGDGRGFDRAFVPTAGAGGDSALVAQLAALRGAAHPARAPVSTASRGVSPGATGAAGPGRRW
jgi:hypothetical protein